MYKKDDRKSYDRLNDNEKTLWDLFSDNVGIKITRKQLRELLGLNDQAMRNCLRTIKAIVPICNFQDGEGYWLSDNVEEVMRMYKQEKHRLKELKKSVYALETFLKDKGAL